MRLVFIHPPLDARPSGGNVFNRQIIRQARETSFPLEAVEVPPDGAIPYLPRNAIILWDSLLLEDLSNYPLEQFPIRCQSARQVGRQSLADLSARQRTLSEGQLWRSQRCRLRLEGSRLKRPFAIGKGLPTYVLPARHEAVHRDEKRSSRG